MSFFPNPNLPFSQGRRQALPQLIIPEFPRHRADSHTAPPHVSSITPSPKPLIPRFKVSPTDLTAFSGATTTPYPYFHHNSTFSASSSPTSPPCRLEIVSLTPSLNPTSSYLSLILRLKNFPYTTQHGIFHQVVDTLRYSPISTTNNTPLVSPTSSNSTTTLPTQNASNTPPLVSSTRNAANSTPAASPTQSALRCTPTQYEKISKALTKTPKSIFSNANFGDPWYILEITELHGESYFALIATYSYQLLLSSLKYPSQLYLRKPDGGDNHVFYERFDLAYEERKLGKLSRVGYLGVDNTVNSTKPVFIKMLDLSAGPMQRDDIVVDLMGQVDCIYNEINLLCNMPIHPHIIFPPIGYVTLGSKEGEEKVGRKIVGFVGEYYKNGPLSDYLFLKGEPNIVPVPRPITILQKAKWALQITSAIIHLHRKAHMSMGDGGRGFGLERFLVDENLQLHMTGFGTGEKVPRISWRVPPETRIRGEWDVSIREDCKLKGLVWKRNNYVRLRWEQDNLMGLVGLGPGLPSTLIPSVFNSCTPIRSITNSTSGNHGGYGSIEHNINTVKFIKHGKGKAHTRGLSGEGPKRNHEDCEKKETEKKNEKSKQTKEELAPKERIAKIDNSWSAFEEWYSTPKALEVVETYSLGVMLWLLFEQIPSKTFSEGGGEINVFWTQNMRIPGEWRALVEACVKKDPGDRVGIDEVFKTFTAEVGRRWDGGWVTG